jgi:hypothetical protein
MPDDLLVNIAMTHLEVYHFKGDNEQLQISHTATGLTYDTLGASMMVRMSCLFSFVIKTSNDKMDS